MDTCAWRATLSSKYNPDEDTAYVAVNIIDSLHQVKVYLVNNSHKDLVFNGSHNRIFFNEEVKDRHGEWITINRNYHSCGICGNHIYAPKMDFILPGSSYTWETETDRNWSDGIFETELRYSCETKNTMLVSASYPIRMDIELFLPPRYRYNYLKSNDLLKDLTPLRERDLIYFNAMNLYAHGLNDESKVIVQQLFNSYPNYYRTYLLYGILIIRKINQNRNSSDYEKFVLISKAIQQWKIIPKGNKNHAKAVEYINTYSPYLPTKEEWSQLITNDCKVIDGQYHCPSTILPGELVLIQFSD